MRAFRGSAKTSLRLMVVTTLVVTALVVDSRTDQVAVADAATVCSPDRPVVVGADGRSVSARPQSVVQVWPTGAICEFEQRIVAQIAAERGAPLTEQIRGEIMSYGRNEVRGRLFVQLLGLLDGDPGTLDPVERGALDWFVDRYGELRLDIAQNARNEYDRWLDEQCDYDPPEGFTYFGGACGDLTALFTKPDPPKYSEFVSYGVAVTSAELLDEPGANEQLDAILSAVVKASIVVTTAAVAAAVAAVVWSVVKTVVFPFLRQAGSFVRLAGPVGIIVGAVVTSIIRGIEIIQQTQIPVRLDQDITIAERVGFTDAATASRTQGGLSELALAFLNATSPDYPDPDPSVVPPAEPPSDAPLWVVKDAHVPPTLTDSRTFTMIGLDNSINRVWMKDGWFVVQPIEPSGPIRLDPVLSFRNNLGFPTTAQFIDGQFLVESFSSYGGDQPTECRLPACALTLDIEHLVDIDGAPNPQTATYAGFAPQIESGPTVTGHLEVGSQVTLEVVATDVETAELDYEWTVSRASVNGDGTATQTYRTRTPRHRWAGPGTYTISVVVTDDAGARASAATTVEVSSVPTDLSVRTQYFLNGAFRNLPLRQNEGGRIVVDSTESGVCLSVDWQSDGVIDVSQFVAGNSVMIDTPANLPAGIVATEITAVSESCESTEVIGGGTFPLEVLNSPPTDVVIELLDPDPARGWRESSDRDASDLPTFVEGSSIPVRVSARDHPTDQLTFYAQWQPGGEVATRSLLFDQHPPDSEGTSRVEASLAAVDQRDVARLIIWVSDGDLLDGDLAFYRIVNAEPVIESFETTADQFGNVGLQVRVSDPGNAQREIERISIDWGDGSEPDDLDIEFSFDGEPLDVDVAGVGVHRYPTSGTYTATVTAFDDVTSVQRTIDISVPEFKPVISDVATLDIGVEGEQTTLAVVIDDPDTDPTELDVHVDWGDGTTSSATYDPTWEPPAFVARHTYAALGTYGVTVTAVDGPDREAAVLQGEITVPDRPVSVTVEQGAGQLDPTSESTITFDVEFSEPVTGFEGDDVVVSGTAGASLVNVVDRGDGTTFAVEVSGMGGTGTVTADVVAGAAFNDDGVPNVASTSTDNEVLYIRPIQFELPGIDGVVTVENEPGRAGAVVVFEASATGGVGVPEVVCVPASGSFFGLGATEVTCVAGGSAATTRAALRAESAGLSASASFKVQVNDTEAPTVEPFTDVVETSTDGNSVNVEFSVPGATDNSGSVTVECVPASSSLFAVGVTTVTCTATDASGNTATSLGTVTVRASDAPTVTVPETVPAPGTATAPGPGRPPTADDTRSPVDILPSTGTALGGTILAALTLLMIGLVLLRSRRRLHHSS